MLHLDRGEWVRTLVFGPQTQVRRTTSPSTARLVGFYRAEVQHFTCDTGLHRGEADITLTASNAGCHLGSFHFEFDVNGMTAQVSGPPDPSGTIGTLSCINGTTLEFDGNEVQGSAAYCTEMTSVSWFQSWPNIQIGSQCRPL